MKHKRLHCWDCGTRVMSQNAETGSVRPDSSLQQVKFGLSDGSYMVNPFCSACASAEWTPERMESFRQAIVDVMPSFNKTIVAFEGLVALDGRVQVILA